MSDAKVLGVVGLGSMGYGAAVSAMKRGVATFGLDSSAAARDRNGPLMDRQHFIFAATITTSMRKPSAGMIKPLPLLRASGAEGSASGRGSG